MAKRELTLEEKDDLIRIPRLRKVNGHYQSEQEIDEEQMKRRFTCIVNKGLAQRYKLNYVCHHYEDCNPHEPFDRTPHVNPYQFVLTPQERVAYAESVREYAKKSEIGPVVKANYDRQHELNRKVAKHRITEDERNERYCDEEERRESEKAVVVCPITKRDLQKMDSGEIYRYLSYYVKRHTACVQQVSQILSRINQPIQEATNRIIKMVFCGSSGIGKSELVSRIAVLCRMHMGGEYEACHLKLNFSTCLDKSHANIITGSGPAYIGFDQPCLVDRLCDALEFIQAKASEAANNKRVKLILLNIEEVDKGTSDIFMPLNEFLDRGSITSHRNNKTFVLPPDVFLLVCASGNFASDYFNALPLDGDEENVFNPEEAKTAIKEAMLAKGLGECDIVRLGNIIPFFPIRKKHAKEILAFKLKDYIAKNGLYLADIEMCMNMSALDQEAFIDFLIERSYLRKQGIRQLLDRMNEELECNRTAQVEFMRRNLAEYYPHPLNKRPELHFHTIPADKATSMAAVALDAYLDLRDRSNILITDRLQDCIGQKSDIAYFFLDHELLDLHGIYVLTPMQKNTTVAPSDEVPISVEMARLHAFEKEIVSIVDSTEIPEEVKLEVIRSYLSAPALVENDDENKSKHEKKAKKHHKDKSKSKKHRDGDKSKSKKKHADADDEPKGKKKRKRDNDVEHAAASEKKIKCHDGEKPRGRCRQEFEGFTYYDAKYKRSRYQCDMCHAIRDTRSIANHKCGDCT